MFTQLEEEKVRGLIGAFENGKKISDLPEATSENPEDYTVEVVQDGESKALNLSKLFPKDDVEWYGIEWDTTVADPACTRIGTMDLHRTLPVHSQMKGCLLNDDGTVASYLSEDNWSSATLDGSAGQVMVEIPEYYVRFEEEGTIRRVKMATNPIDGFTKVPKCYVSAYHAAMDRTNNKLASVVNLTPQYRGGNNNADWDGTYRELLGRPASSISLIDFSAAARARKADSTEWNTMTYEIWKNLHWLFVVEYATLNTQAPYTAERTAEGYQQGGLGNGVTTLDNWSFNNYYPFVPCGYTNGFGNGTCVKSYIQSTNDEDASGAIEVSVPRYRGIEMPFDHIGTWCDGLYVFEETTPETVFPVQVKVAVPLSTDDMTNAILQETGFLVDGEYVEPDTAVNWNEFFADETRFRVINAPIATSADTAEAEVFGLLRVVTFGEHGDIVAKEMANADNATSVDNYHCDIQAWIPPLYANSPVFISAVCGGNAYNGAACGLACVVSESVAANAYTVIGSRLCFIPA